MRRLPLTVGLLAVAVPAAVGAQKTPTVISLDDGRSIYVSGLRSWTVDMVQDSLARYAPTVSLYSHSCAAVLRYKLHFADAAVMTLSMGRGTPDVVFVDVREPQDSSRVKYRTIPVDTVAPRPEWRAVTQAMSDSPRTFHTAARSFLSGTPHATTDSAAAAIVAFLRERNRPSDFRDALEVLDGSPNYQDRTVAALILSNFPDETATWQALLDGMRESDGPVKSLSAQSLASVSGKSSRAPDWLKLASTIGPMLDGTSLFVLDDLIGILSQRTEIGQEHAVPFLAAGGEMLVSLAANPHPVRSAPARALLVKLAGQDLGSDPADWSAWIAQLPRPAT